MVHTKLRAVKDIEVREGRAYLKCSKGHVMAIVPERFKTEYAFTSGMKPRRMSCPACYEEKKS